MYLLPAPEALETYSLCMSPSSFPSTLGGLFALSSSDFSDLPVVGEGGAKSLCIFPVALDESDDSSALPGSGFSVSCTAEKLSTERSGSVVTPGLTLVDETFRPDGQND